MIAERDGASSPRMPQGASAPRPTHLNPVLIGAGIVLQDFDVKRWLSFMPAA
jgi:hypothetical protein